MKPEARARFLPFLIACGEGSLTWLYLDAKGLVTIGIGCMLPTLAAALALAWTHGEGGPPAGADDVRTAWAAVTGRRDLAGAGGGHFRDVTTIRVTPGSIAKLIDDDIARFEVTLQLEWPGYDDAPAPAQEALMRLAWALGSHFPERGGWPKLRAAWAARDWRTCAAECRIPELDATEPRANHLEADLFLEAAGDEPAPATDRAPDVTDGGQDRPVYCIDLEPDTEPPAAA